MQRRGLNIRKALLGTILPALRKFLPPRAAARAVAGIGRVEYRLRADVRHRVDAAIERGNLHFGGHWDAPRVGPALAGNQIRWRVRDRLLDGLPDDRVAELFRVDGREHLEAALAGGRGVVLLCSHFGSHMTPPHWLLRQGYTVRLFQERPRHISRYLAREFDTDGPLGQRKLFISRRATTAESAASILRAARVLGSGAIVMIACDVRWAGAATVPARFLGACYHFSTTWVSLAAISSAPVVPVFCRMDDDGSYDLEFLEPFAVPADARQAEDVVPYVQAALGRVEDRVRAHPENSNDYLFWAEGAEAAERTGSWSSEA